jgi:hypothetical protein
MSLNGGRASDKTQAIRPTHSIAHQTLVTLVRLEERRDIKQQKKRKEPAAPAPSQYAGHSRCRRAILIIIMLHRRTSRYFHLCASRPKSKSPLNGSAAVKRDERADPLALSLSLSLSRYLLAKCYPCARERHSHRSPPPSAPPPHHLRTTSASPRSKPLADCEDEAPCECLEPPRADEGGRRFVEQDSVLTLPLCLLPWLLFSRFRRSFSSGCDSLAPLKISPSPRRTFPRSDPTHSICPAAIFK